MDGYKVFTDTHRSVRLFGGMDPVTSKMYYVYVLRSSKSGNLYTGCTSDLRKRFIQHTSGLSPYTKGRGPYSLIYYEACLNKKDAFVREKYLKSGPGKKFLKNRIKRFLEVTG